MVVDLILAIGSLKGQARFWICAVVANNSVSGCSSPIGILKWGRVISLGATPPKHENELDVFLNIRPVGD